MALSFRDTESSSIHQKKGTSPPNQKNFTRSSSTHSGHMHNEEELPPSSLQKEDPPNTVN